MFHHLNFRGQSAYIRPTDQISCGSKGVWWERRGIDRHLESIAEDVERNPDTDPEDFLLWRCCKCEVWDRKGNHAWVYSHGRRSPYLCSRDCSHFMCGKCAIWVPYGVAVTLSQVDALARRNERVSDQEERLALERERRNMEDPALLITSGTKKHLDEIRRREQARENMGPSAEEDEATIATIPQRPARKEDAL